jgi:hypothetical protein
LIEYCPRYAQVLRDRNIGFHCPTVLPDLQVGERLVGNSTTDFGAPATPSESDKQPMDDNELERFKVILVASWRVLDNSIRQVAGFE